jgi:hypothetical protein
MRVVRVRECRAFEEEWLCSVDALQARQNRRDLLVPYRIDNRQRACFFAKPARRRTEPRFDVAFPFGDSPRCQVLDPVVACEFQEQRPLVKRGRLGVIAFEEGGQQAQQRRAVGSFAGGVYLMQRGAGYYSHWHSDVGGVRLINVPRVTFADWFQSQPDFLATLKLGAERTEKHEVY